MPRARPVARCGRQAARLPLAALAIVLACADTAPAQQSLRGTVRDPSPLVLTGRTGTGSAPAVEQAAPAYEPSSPGALPAAPEPATEGDEPLADADAARPASRSLSPESLDDIATAGTRAGPVETRQDHILDPGAERERAIEQPQTAREDDPFAAAGIRMGSFILKPTLETGLTATTNADSTPGGEGALQSETTLRLNAVSDWRSGSLTMDAYGTWRTSLSGADLDELSGGLDTAAVAEIGKDLRARGTLGYLAEPESASSPDSVAGAASQPLRQTFSGSLGLDKDVGKGRFGLTGRIEHDRFGDAKLLDGSTLSQDDRESTLYAAELRLGYEISPALTPFVEGEVGRRLYSLRHDSAGYARSSHVYGMRAGLAVDLGEKFSGEVAAGWLREEFDDARLRALSSPALEAALSWSPQRGTTVGLNATTTLEGTNSAGESGSVLYAGRLTVERQVRSNLTAAAAFGAAWRDYSGSDGHDLTLDAEASLTWWLNRYAGLTLRGRHETVQSNIEGRDSTTDSVFLGLKLQR